MKVKVGELKTHLSSYLRKLEETGEPMEVCVRERTVAYLTPAGQAGKSDEDAIREKLSRLGISWDGNYRSTDKLPLFEPEVAGDGHQDVDTIREMRGEKDW